MKIAVAGTGYVGLANAVLLAQDHEVVAFDIDPERVRLINDKKSPIVDEDISNFLATQPLNLRGTLEATEAFTNADYVIIATPTNYDPETDYFDTKTVETVIEQVLSIEENATIVIKSTIPVGYTKSVNEQLKTNQVIFSPEFLREGQALHDNLYPSRIIVGEDSERAKTFANLLANGAKKENIP